MTVRPAPAEPSRELVYDPKAPTAPTPPTAPTAPTESRQADRAIGRRIAGRDNRKLARGRARYVADIRLPGVHHVHIVRSPHAHALISGIDTAAALAAPGVVAVVTGADVKAKTRPIPEGWDTSAVGAKKVDWYALAPERVRFVGEAVAAVVAVDRASAEAAGALVEVDYDVQPAVTSAAAAVGAASPLVEPAWGDNLLFEESFQSGDLDGAFAGASVIEGRVSSQRISGLPLEPRGILASYDSGESLIRMWESTQQPHLVRAYVAQALGIPERGVVVTMPQVGGAFGLKQPTSQEEVLLAFLANELRIPVRWIEQRYEGLEVGGHARETSCTYRAAFDGSGRLLGLEVDLLADVGAPTAFLGWGMSVVTMFTLPTVYKVPSIAVRLRSVVTNKGPWAPCRGFGKDVATLLMERVLDQIADETGIDRVAVRRANLIGADEFPYRHVSGGVIDSGDYATALARVAEAVGYDDFAARREAAARDGRRIGVGVAMELTPEGVAVAGSLMNNGYDGATVRIMPTGDVTVLSGVTSPGTGNETGLAQIAADALSCDVDRVSVVQGHTDACPWGLGNYSSRSIIIGGSAVEVAAGELSAKLRTVAAS
jgi:carbon-monoxide dehydrogenase large subunit